MGSYNKQDDKWEVIISNKSNDHRDLRYGRENQSIIGKIKGVVG